MQSRTSKHWVAGYPHLVAQWHPTKNGDVFPDEVSYGSGRSLWWKCSEGPDHEWKASANSRTRGQGCPFCAGQRVSVTNSLASLRPEIAAEWHPTKNRSQRPERVVCGSRRDVWWKCEAGEEHEWKTSIANRTNPKTGTGCPFCAGRKVSRTNSLEARYPLLASQWHSTRNGRLTSAQVIASSHRRVWWQCPVDRSHVYDMTANARVNGQGCPFCAHRRLSPATSLAVRHPELAQQWHPTLNGTLRPHDVSFGSSQPVWWRCPAGHEWQASPSLRSPGRKCPFCSGHRVAESNALASLAPQVAAQWHPTKNLPLRPHEVTAGSSRNVWWKCPAGDDHQWQAVVNDRVAVGLGCPFCSGRRASKARSLATMHPGLARQWHPTRNGVTRARDVLPRSSLVVWWKCRRGPDHEWQTSVKARLDHDRVLPCPFCNGKRLSVTNSLAALFPAVARQWHRTRNGARTPRGTLAGSGFRAWWKCAGGHVWQATVAARAAGGTGCPRCRDERRRGSRSGRKAQRSD